MREREPYELPMSVVCSIADVACALWTAVRGFWLIAGIACAMAAKLIAYEVQIFCLRREVARDGQ